MKAMKRFLLCTLIGLSCILWIFPLVDNALGLECNGQSACEHILPTTVGMYMSESSMTDRLPAVTLTAFAGGGCDQVSDLQISEELKPNQNNIYTKGGRIDVLELTIDGYDLKRPDNVASLTCPAVIAEARVRIDLSKHMKKSQLRLSISLNDRKNIYDLNHYQGITYLNPVESANIISWNPGENMPEKPQPLGWMAKEFSSRVAQIRLQGAYAQRSDLPTQLRDYVRDLGYVPLDERIHGYPRINPLEGLLVYVPLTEPLPQKFQIVGEVTYRESIAGEKTIPVGIVKARVNPFFVRSR